MSTENPIDILFFQWQQTLKIFSVNPVTASQLFNDLVAVYSLPHRHYHTLQHIHHVLITIDTLQTYAQDISSVQLAAWFHDVVYDTQADDNEEKSANFAGEVLKNLGISNQKITTISHLILHTKHHIPDDLDSQVLLDADLAILAANPVEYQEYAKAIRQEYVWVPKAEYINGRRQVLQRFLERQRIYFTPLMFEVAEQSARSNIRAEIQMLDNFAG
jgi:predicted metal-dependent HD superfamily phosphohydrolase